MRMGYTVNFDNGVYVEGGAAVVGKKEKAGKYGEYFENVVPDDLLGEKTHEKAERVIHTLVHKNLLANLSLKRSDVDIDISGDLLDEITGSSFTMREMEYPYLGIFNACAAFGEGSIIAGSFVNGGLVHRAVTSVSSNFCTAERQFRNPLELGCQRTPLSQWTVTGAAAVSYVSHPTEVRLRRATIGRVVDYGVKDANNMGGAMAPAAMNTLISHFENTSSSPRDYDVIATGDLGVAGRDILKLIIKEKHCPLGDNYMDCGAEIFDLKMQKEVNQGGSGAACSASIFATYFLKKMQKREIKRLLLVPTGALISKTSSLQKDSVPGIAHALEFEVI